MNLTTHPIDGNARIPNDELDTPEVQFVADSLTTTNLTNETTGNSSPSVMISMVVASLAQARHSGSVSYLQQQQRCNNSHGG